MRLEQQLEKKANTSRRRKAEPDLKAERIKVLQENVESLKAEIEEQEKEK